MFLGPPFAPPLNGDTYAFITAGLPAGALSSLRFLIDGVPVGVERFAPYDVAGGSTTMANPFDARRLPDGLHTLTSEFAFAPAAGGYVERMDTAMTIDNSRTDHGFVLGLSGSPDRTSAEFLDGASVGDEVFVFLGRLPLIPDGGPVPAPGDGIDDVRFLLDGVLVQTERVAPYDLGGGTVDEARPFDLSTLATGPHQLEARVRRSDGSSVLVTADFDKLSAGFTLTTVDARQVGLYVSMAVGADGLPVVAYVGDNGSLKVAHCGTVTCTAGNTLTTVDGDPGGHVAGGLGIAIGTDGLPVVSYHDQDKGNLKVAHCGTLTCSSAMLTTVDHLGFVGDDSSLAIGADGLPVISYYDSNGSLKVAHCGSVTCRPRSANTVTTVDSARVGLYNSIAVGVDGLPVVSYWDLSNKDLKVAHCGNVTCTAGNTLTTVDSAGFLGEFSSIAIGADGLPVVSYLHSGVGLKFAHCGNVTCTEATTLTAVDSAGSVGRATSATVGTDGLPVVSYLGLGTGGFPNLKVAHCGDPGNGRPPPAGRCLRRAERS